MTNPKLIVTPFAENGTKNDIPEAGASEPQLATMQAGFPAITQVKISEGGIPPERADFNGILHLYGEHIVHLNKGLPYEFDAAFANKMGGYPLHARIMLSNGDIVRNTVVNNTNNPNSDTTGWDQPYNVYDFKTEQPLQWYFNKFGNWDDAIFQAQLNVYLKGFAPRLLLPNGTITLYKPILGGATLGLKIHQYLKDNNIESDFYNETTKKFKKIWNLILVGQGSNNTVIESRICSDRADRRFVDVAAIYCGQDINDPNFLTGGNTLPYWQNMPTLEGFSLYARFNNTPNDMEMTYAWMHGIYLGGADQVATTKFKIRDLNIDGFVGSGICLDNAYDGRVEQVTFLRCGRMAGNAWDYGFNNNLGVRKQLFAPMHIMKSSGDNSNFIRLYDLHFELNVASVADLIVSGDSSPVWLHNFHFECGAWGGGYAAKSMKVRMAIGDYGADNYLSKDTDATSTTAYSKAGGYVKSTEVTGYDEGYAFGLVMGNYTEFSNTSETVPNGLGNILIEASNTSARLILNNCNAGSIKGAGGNSSDNPIFMSNVTCSSVELAYMNAPVLSNVKCSGDINISNIYTNSQTNKITVLDNVTANNLKGGNLTGGVEGTIYLNGTVSGFYAQRGNLKIINDTEYSTQMDA